MGSRVATSLGALAVIAALTACSSPEERGPRSIAGWSAAGNELRLWIDTCNGDPGTEVVETSAAVTVTVVSTRRDHGDPCQDVVTVALDAPLDARPVLDGATGREAPAMEG